MLELNQPSLRHTAQLSKKYISVCVRVTRTLSHGVFVALVLSNLGFKGEGSNADIIDAVWSKCEC